MTLEEALAKIDELSHENKSLKIDLKAAQNDCRKLVAEIKRLKGEKE